MGQIRKLDKSGDTTTEWDPSNPQEVEAARQAFDLYRKGGYAAARMENGTAGEIIKEFDPSAAQIVMVPPMCGG